MQRWLARSLEPHEPAARLEKGDRRGEQSAFFELALEAHFRSRGTLHSKPTLPSGRPDLLVMHAIARTYFEVATVFDDPKWDEVGRRADVLVEGLRRVRTPYWIRVNLREASIPADVSIRRVRGFVQGVVDRTRTGLHQFSAVHLIPGTHAKFSLWGSRPDGPNGIGFETHQARWLDGYLRVERALEDKDRAYPEIAAEGAPYVVVICSGSWFAISEEEVVTAAYGTQQIDIEVPLLSGHHPKAHEPVRRGGVLNQRADGTFKNRGISAVLFLREDVESHGRPLRAKVLHHPDPLVPLPRDVFGYLPQTVFARRDELHVDLSFAGGNDRFQTD